MKYKIYQQSVIRTYTTPDKIRLSSCQENPQEIEDISRRSLRDIKEHELSFTYKGEVENSDIIGVALETLYRMFNADNRPTGKYATSLTMGDIVQLEDDYYIVAAYGFKKVNVVQIQ